MPRPPPPRLLLPYERHIKGEKDKPLPSVKPRKQEGGQDKAGGAKAKGAGVKKAKGSSNLKQGSKKDKEETAQGQEHSQVSRKPLPPLYWLSCCLIRVYGFPPVFIFSLVIPLSFCSSPLPLLLSDPCVV